MKKIKTILILLIIILFFLGCTQESIQQDTSQMQENQKTETKTTTDVLTESTSDIKTPVAKFTKEDIDKLKINCSGTDAEISECIYSWQVENMIYVQTAETEEGPFLPSYELRWQEILPGIYTSKDLIENHISSGTLNPDKLYGVCWGFSVVYCSIAEYYGLDCRIIETETNLNEEDRAGGMSPAEYEELSPWLKKQGLNYTYDAIRLTVPSDSGIAGHYWAEVKLSETSAFDNNGWRNMDASNIKYDGRQNTQEYIEEGKEWKVVNWSTKDKTEILDEYMVRIEAGEDLRGESAENKSDMEEFMEGRDFYADDLEGGRLEAYIGITDELGNENRAATIDDFMQGMALAPYMASCRDSCDFIMGGDACKNNCESLDEEPAKCYKSCAGEEFFIVCDYICEDASDSEWPECYKSCSGNTLNIKCDCECWDD